MARNIFTSCDPKVMEILDSNLLTQTPPYTKDELPDAPLVSAKFIIEEENGDDGYTLVTYISLKIMVVVPCGKNKAGLLVVPPVVLEAGSDGVSFRTFFLFEETEEMKFSNYSAQYFEAKVPSDFDGSDAILVTITNCNMDPKTSRGTVTIVQTAEPPKKPLPL